MFVDVVVKYKGEAERNIATIGRDTSYLNDVVEKFESNHDLEYIKLELPTYWRNKLEENQE